MTGQAKCPDCQGELHEIKLIDKSHLGIHTAMEYTVPESRRGFWTGHYPIEGRVAALMCSGCGRILLYGAPHER